MGTKTVIIISNCFLSSATCEKRIPKHGDENPKALKSMNTGTVQVKKNPQTWGRKLSSESGFFHSSHNMVKKESPNMGTKGRLV